MELSGTAALVTGAASGIGRASAIAFAAAGCAGVTIVDVDRNGGEETAGLVRGAGAQPLVVAADVQDVASLRAAFDRSVDAFGRLDVVHNNAGLLCGEPEWPDTPPKRITEVVNVNVVGCFLGTRLAIDYLKSGGAVVNTASVAGLSAFAQDPVYSATKAAIILFTQSCTQLKFSHGVRVNAVLPGMVATPMIDKTGDGTRPAQWLQAMLTLVDLLPAERVAGAVVELARDDRMAGQTVTVNNEAKVALQGGSA